MEFPAYVQSVVKYKSPHPGELSFSKGEVIRVLGYAERIDQPDEDEDDEDDHWYVGETLDKQRSGQFPGSLVMRTEAPAMQEEPMCVAGTGAAAAPVAVPQDRAPNEAEQAPRSASMHMPMDASAEAPAVAPTAEMQMVADPAVGTQVEDEPTGGTQVVDEPAATAPAAVEPTATVPTKVEPTATAPAADERTSTVPAAGTDPAVPGQVADTVPNGVTSTSETSAAEEQFDSAPMPTAEAHAPAAFEPTRAESVQPHPTSQVPHRATQVPGEHEAVDPSRLSLRDRIATFNKPAEKAPPPIPRGKPGGWKRPVPAASSAAAPGEAAARVPPPAHVDARSEPASDEHSSFSASDAKSSIKMSLRERMAALQRSDAESRTVAAPRPVRQLSHDMPAENEGAAEPSTEDDAERRAALTRRMAAIGGRRLDPGLFGQSPAREAPLAEAPPEAEAAAAPKADTSEAQAPQPLAVPRRTAAPRTRRARPAEPPAPTAVAEPPAEAAAPPADTSSEPGAEAAAAAPMPSTFEAPQGAVPEHEAALPLDKLSLHEAPPLAAPSDAQRMPPQAPLNVAQPMAEPAREHTEATSLERTPQPAALPLPPDVTGAAPGPSDEPLREQVNLTQSDLPWLNGPDVKSMQMSDTMAEMRAVPVPRSIAEPHAHASSPVSILFDAPALDAESMARADSVPSSHENDPDAAAEPPMLPAAEAGEQPVPAVALQHVAPTAPAQPDATRDAAAATTAAAPVRVPTLPPLDTAEATRAAPLGHGEPSAASLRSPPTRSAPPAPVPARLSDDSDFASERRQLEQLLQYAQAPEEPHTLLPPTTRRNSAPMSPEQTLAPPARPRSANRPKSPLSEYFAMSPSPGRRTPVLPRETAPTCVMTPLSPPAVPQFTSPRGSESDEPPLPPEQGDPPEQERRELLARRMARLGGRRVPGAPIMPMPICPAGSEEADGAPVNGTVCPRTPLAAPEPVHSAQPPPPARSPRHVPMLSAEVFAPLGMSAPRSIPHAAPPTRKPPSRPPPPPAASLEDVYTAYTETPRSAEHTGAPLYETPLQHAASGAPFQEEAPPQHEPAGAPLYEAPPQHADSSAPFCGAPQHMPADVPYDDAPVSAPPDPAEHMRPPTEHMFMAYSTDAPTEARPVRTRPMRAPPAPPPTGPFL